MAANCDSDAHSARDNCYVWFYRLEQHHAWEMMGRFPATRVPMSRL